MSGMSPSGGDFSARLQQALAKAKGQASAVAPPAEASVPDPLPPADDFSERLGAAMSKAQGEPEPTQAAAPEEQQSGPVGQGDHVVREGDCISSIAVESGHFWKTIWDEPANQELVTVREDPNVLLPDDRVTVPDLRRKDEDIAAEQRHRFRRKGEPSKMHIRLLENDEPLANRAYTLRIDSRSTIEGATDADGNVQLPIPGNARRAKLTLHAEEADEEERVYFFDLGAMPPVEDYSGVQKRLQNLGYEVERTDGREDEATTHAIAAFQSDHELSDSGEADQETRDRLEEAHGS
jgi:N-acetylmuramoyl-L-alanine amidase